MHPTLIIAELDPAYRAIWSAEFVDVPGVTVEPLTDGQLLRDNRVDAAILAGQILERLARRPQPGTGETYDDGYPAPGGSARAERRAHNQHET